MSFKTNRVCKEHKEFSRDCAVCKLEAAQNEMVLTFWYITKCSEGPYLGGPMMCGSQGSPETIPPQIATNEEAMKVRLDHIMEVATTMLERFGDSMRGHWPGIGRGGASAHS